MGLLMAVGRTLLDLGGVYFWFLVMRVLAEKYRRWRWRRIRVRATQQWMEQHRSVG